MLLISLLWNFFLQVYIWWLINLHQQKVHTHIQEFFSYGIWTYVIIVCIIFWFVWLYIIHKYKFNRIIRLNSWIDPLCNIKTKGGIAPRAPIKTLFSSNNARLSNAQAAFCLDVSLPLSNTWTNGLIPPNRLIIYLFSSNNDKFSKAVTECSWIHESEQWSKAIRAGTAPNSPIDLIRNLMYKSLTANFHCYLFYQNVVLAIMHGNMNVSCWDICGDMHVKFI